MPRHRARAWVGVRSSRTGAQQTLFPGSSNTGELVFGISMKACVMNEITLVAVAALWWLPVVFSVSITVVGSGASRGVVPFALALMTVTMYCLPRQPATRILGRVCF